MVVHERDEQEVVRAVISPVVDDHVGCLCESHGEGAVAEARPRYRIEMPVATPVDGLEDARLGHVTMVYRVSTERQASSPIGGLSSTQFG